ncbi:unnamed protein product [Urochloa humidicola]
MIPSRGEVLATLIVPLISLATIAEAQATQRPTTLAGCPDKCGDISIPYPFGMAPGCFVDGFEVTCNSTFNPPRPFLAVVPNGDYPLQQNADGYYLSTQEWAELNNVWASPVELIDISLVHGEARAYAAVTTDCATNDTYHKFRRQATQFPASSPFLVSQSRNVLTGIGWNIEAQLTMGLRSSGYKVACLSRLADPSFAQGGSCSGMGCCEANVTAGLLGFSVTFVHKNSPLWGPNPCSYGMVLQRYWYNFSSEDLYGYEGFSRKNPRGVPFVIDFAIRNGSCPGPAQGVSPPEHYACLSGNSSCVNATSGPGYLCKCWEHYDGNPYIPDGCQDIDECELRKQHPDLRVLYPCSSDGVCKNRLGGYDCPCKPGMKGDGKAGTCTEKFPLVAKVIVGAIGGFFLIAILSFAVLLHKEKKKMRESFIKNGGTILEKVQNIKIFKKEELKRITKNYSIILGQGNFGVVYKGLINDFPVAVKMSNKVDSMQKEQFANEVIIQSQVIHKNIVRLLGCCLEVDVPILVYEFVSKGSLEDILHGGNKVPLTLDLRLGIAAESAEGLAYMHCKTNTNIQHGDVKPANILLDDNFVPKISDFGISRLLARGKIEHASNVIGDNNYMDPVYRQTGLLTNKSDVYSFGIVLFELITGKKAAYGGDSSFIRTYLDTYITGMRENRAKELFEEVNKAQNDIEDLYSIVGITKECLNNDVDQRPEMTDIAERLQNIRRARKK